MAVWLERAGELVWGPWTVVPVLAVGCLLSVRSGWFQLTGIRRWWGATAGALLRPKGGEGISPFQSATAALAGSLGTGNIVGVATAIGMGGPGAVLWMWVAAIPGMMISCAENVLGIRYRKRDAEGNRLGGPMLYMRDGLGAPRLAALWAGLCALAAMGVGNIVQVNAIAETAQAAWSAPRWLTGVVIAAAAAPAIIGGARAVTKLTERLVPFMAAGYMLMCAAVILLNADRLPGAFAAIFKGAFTPTAAGGGVLGAMLVGVRRGVFTNEAGMGSTVLIHCTAETDDPLEQGMWGIFEIFLDTIVMCTLTALALLTGAPGKSGTQAVTEVFAQLLGRWSGSFVAAATLVFAFATVVGWSCCGERACAYLLGSRASRWYRMVYTVVILPGCLSGAGAVWALGDLLNALLMLPNLAAVVMLEIREPTCPRSRQAQAKKFRQPFQRLRGQGAAPLVALRRGRNPPAPRAQKTS